MAKESTISLTTLIPVPEYTCVVYEVSVYDWSWYAPNQPGQDGLNSHCHRLLLLLDTAQSGHDLRHGDEEAEEHAAEAEDCEREEVVAVVVTERPGGCRDLIIDTLALSEVVVIHALPAAGQAGGEVHQAV